MTIFIAMWIPLMLLALLANSRSNRNERKRMDRLAGKVMGQLSQEGDSGPKEPDW